MLKNCAKSCNSCERAGSNLIDDLAVDSDQGKPQRMDDTALRESHELLKRTGKFGATQIADGNRRKDTIENVKSMIDYMEKSDDFLGLPAKLQENCKNKVRDGEKMINVKESHIVS